MIIDIQYALEATGNGRFGCALYKFKHRRVNAEVRAWEGKSQRYSINGYGGMMSTSSAEDCPVPKENPQYEYGPWLTDPDCKHKYQNVCERSSRDKRECWSP